MGTQARIEQLRKLREESLHAGSQRAVDRQHELGKLTARERLEILLDKTGATIEPLYGFRSLAASKHKFHPTHTSWNLAYDDELALPSIGLAVVSCYLPDMKTADMAAVVKEFLSRRDQTEATSPAAAPTPRP